MPSPEGSYTGGREDNREREAGPFYMASRFHDEQPAKLACFQAHELIFGGERADLLAYRFQVNRANHLAVVGAPPPDDLQFQLQDILALGEAVALPQQIVKALLGQRAQMKKEGP